MDSLFEGLIQNIPAIFFRCNCDKDWTIHFINNAIEELTGFSPNDLIQNKVRTFASIVHPDDNPKILATVEEAMAKAEPWTVEYRLITVNGETKWVAETGVAIYSETGELQFLDGFILDITERKKIQLALKASQQQIRDMAFTDSVTGLANRNLFSDRLDQLILDSKRYNAEFALLFIDLDHFKTVNDNHGHLVGDKLLSMAGERISSSFRESDVVARFGGDEFLVIVKNTSGTDDMEHLATSLLKKMAASYYIDDMELCVTCSIGIAFFSNDKFSSLEIIQQADKAMYAAKLAGKNHFKIYSAPSYDEQPDADEGFDGPEPSPAG